MGEEREREEQLIKESGVVTRREAHTLADSANWQKRVGERKRKAAGVCGMRVAGRKGVGNG